MKTQLKEAKRFGFIVCITRAEIDPGRDLAEIVAIGKYWFLARRIGDHIRYDGFSLMRIEDVTQLDAPHRYADFVKRALALRGEEPPAAPDIDLKSTESTLRSACEVARVVSIHWEDLAPDECSIGRYVETVGKEFSFREVNPKALWNRDLAEHSFADLTRIDLLGGYEEALADVIDDARD